LDGALPNISGHGLKKPAACKAPDEISPLEHRSSLSLHLAAVLSQQKEGETLVYTPVRPKGDSIVKATANTGTPSPQLSPSTRRGQPHTLADHALRRTTDTYTPTAAHDPTPHPTLCRDV
jgi:hypothetical protein